MQPKREPIMGRPNSSAKEFTEQVGDERGDGANDQVAKGNGDADDDQRGEVSS